MGRQKAEPDSVTCGFGRLLLCVLCGASALWSIAPHRSLAATGQLAVILAASLALIAGRTIGPASGVAGVQRNDVGACARGVAPHVLRDAALHFPLQRHLAPRGGVSRTQSITAARITLPFCFGRCWRSGGCRGRYARASAGGGRRSHGGVHRREHNRTRHAAARQR